MSFFIRNMTLSPIEIGDLGLTVEVGTDLDLVPETANSIAISSELIAHVIAGNINVVDPLDGVTLLNNVDSLTVVQSANDPHFGINGGKLNQIDDVDVLTPLNDYVLTYNSTSSKWEPKQPQSGSASNLCFPFYRADGNADSITVVSGFFPFYRADGTYDPINLENCI